MTKVNVCKICRRAQTKLFLKGEKCLSSKCPLLKRNYPPGQTGFKRGRKLSSYGLEMREKQKVKAIYGLDERQIRRFLTMFNKSRDKEKISLFSFLERRLDNVVFRLGFASSLKEARQLVSHGHFKVNDQKVNIPSYLVKAKDEVTPKKGGKIKLKKGKSEVPSWLKLDPKTLKGKVLKLPFKEDIVHDIDEDLVIKFYSR